MPNYSKHEIILVRYPFSDLSSSKVRPAVVVSTRFPRHYDYTLDEQSAIVA